MREIKIQLYTEIVDKIIREEMQEILEYEHEYFNDPDQRTKVKLAAAAILDYYSEPE